MILYFFLQVETLNEDIALIKDILRLPGPNLLLGSSSHSHDGFEVASLDSVHNAVTKIRMQADPIQDETEGFIQKNKSPSNNKAVEQFDAMLSDTERNLIYTAYYQDYLLFDFAPHS